MRWIYASAVAAEVIDFPKDMAPVNHISRSMGRRCPIEEPVEAVAVGSPCCYPLPASALRIKPPLRVKGLQQPPMANKGRMYGLQFLSWRKDFSLPTDRPRRGKPLQPASSRSRRYRRSAIFTYRVSLSGKSCAAWQLALKRSLHDRAVRHLYRLPVRIRNRGRFRVDGESPRNDR
jgi:hypothetical protein